MWPFSKKTPQPRNPINEDWAIGDLAECLAEGDWEPDPEGPENGDVLKVIGIDTGPVGLKNEIAWRLQFAPWKGVAFASEHFRKVPPLSEQESFTITAKIKRCKRSTAPA